MRLLHVFLAVLLVLGMNGCETKSSSPPSALSPATPPLNLDYALTKGNHSYIPINREGEPHDMDIEILKLVAAFEDKHPEWEITSFHVEKQQLAEYGLVSIGAQVFGLWVHHRPKANCPK